MRYLTFGRTGLEVSAIAMGTWQLGGDWGEFDRDEAITAIRAARDAGITFFDTAQGYGFGASEELLAEALRDDLDRRRDEVVIATKGALRPIDDGITRDSSPEFVRSGVEDSLRHLGVDHIDLWQVHWPDADVPFADTAAELGTLVDEGKIRHVGVSNFSADQIRAFSETYPVESLQPPYHMFRRGYEDETLPYCRGQDIGVLVYGPLAHGLLTGTMSEDTTFPDDDWRGSNDAFQGDGFRQNLKVVERLKGVASDVGCSLPQLATAWALSNPAVHVAIVGSRSPEHIKEGAEAAEIELSSDVRTQIEDILTDATPMGGATPENT